jgi:hypothetical protein
MRPPLHGAPRPSRRALLARLNIINNNLLFGGNQVSKAKTVTTITGQRYSNAKAPERVSGLLRRNERAIALAATECPNGYSSAIIEQGGLTAKELSAKLCYSEASIAEFARELLTDTADNLCVKLPQAQQIAECYNTRIINGDGVMPYRLFLFWIAK